MRWAVEVCLLLTATCVAAGTITDEPRNFRLSWPEESWDQVEPDHESCAVILRTQIGDEAYDATEFRVHVDGSSHPLDAVLKKWKEFLEKLAGENATRKESEAELGGVKFRRVDLRGTAHVTWWAARHGKLTYLMRALRTGEAIGDEDIEEELGKIVASLTFLREPEPEPKKPDAKPGPEDADSKPEPEGLEREERADRFWRLRWVKPQGMVEEKATDGEAIFQCSGKQGQSGCMIRIYAAAPSGGTTFKYSLEALVTAVRKAFETEAGWRRRKPIEQGSVWKIPLRKKVATLRLTGMRLVTQVHRWYFAECRNDRQYRVWIRCSGATAETDWRDQIDDFLKNFKPVRRVK